MAHSFASRSLQASRSTSGLTAPSCTSSSTFAKFALPCTTIARAFVARSCKVGMIPSAVISSPRPSMIFVASGSEMRVGSSRLAATTACAPALNRSRGDRGPLRPYSPYIRARPEPSAKTGATVAVFSMSSKDFVSIVSHLRRL